MKPGPKTLRRATAKRQKMNITLKTFYTSSKTKRNHSNKNIKNVNNTNKSGHIGVYITTFCNHFPPHVEIESMRLELNIYTLRKFDD